MLSKSQWLWILVTGKSFSEALILASINQQYEKILFIELSVQHMKSTSAEHGQNMGRTWQEHAQLKMLNKQANAK